MEYTIRPYQNNDKDAVMRLWKAAFNKEMNPDLWEWKFHLAPYGHRIMVCDVAPGQIVSMFSGIAYQTHCFGKMIEMTHMVDNATHPDYQKKGHFIQTINGFIDYFTGPGKSVFLYGFPGAYHFAIGEKYQQYRRLENPLAFWTAPMDDIPESDTMSDVEVCRLRQDDDLGIYDELWNSCYTHYPFCITRNAKLLKWRFLDHPERQYEIWNCRSDARRGIDGYAVFSIDGEIARMVDCFIKPDSALIASFLKKLRIALSGRQVRRIQTWIPENHFIADVLVDLGFQKEREPYGFVPTGRSFDDDIDFDVVTSQMYYTMADGDLL
jgi:hypothetical protein